MDLVEFLRARLAEDEAAVGSGPFGSGSGGWGLAALHGLDYEGLTISRERVLREVESKRMITRLVQMTTGVPTMPAILRCLAAPYADHPDYRDEWKL